MANSSGALLPALRRHSVLAALATMGVACSIAAFLYVRRAVELQEDARFRQVINGSTDAVRDRLHAYTAMLRSARGFFEALGRDPDVAEFHAYVEGLEVGRFYRGLQGLGWAKALRPDELAGHVEATRRRTGQAGYRVWPEGRRELYSSIVMLEPLDWRNQRAIGFDMYSEPVRRAAMARARDTGDVAVSGKVELVQEAGAERQAGFLMYLPVYRAFPERPNSARRSSAAGSTRRSGAADLFRNTLGGADGQHGRARGVRRADPSARPPCCTTTASADSGSHGPRSTDRDRREDLDPALRRHAQRSPRSPTGAPRRWSSRRARAHRC